MTHEIVRVKTKSTGAIKLEEVPEAYKERIYESRADYGVCRRKGEISKGRTCEKIRFSSFS